MYSITFSGQVFSLLLEYGVKVDTCTLCTSAPQTPLLPERENESLWITVIVCHSAPLRIFPLKIK